MATENKTLMPPTCIEACQRVINVMGLYGSRPEVFWQAYDELHTTFPKAIFDEHSDHWVLHYRMLQLIDAVDRYDRRADSRIYDPPTGVFAAVHAIQMELQSPFLRDRQYRPPQSIKQLLRENVPDSQICVEWGLVDREGRVDLDRLNKEIEKPGSVINEKWKHPKQIKCEEKRLEFRREYEGLMHTHFGKGKDPMDNPVAPESAQQLYEQGVEAWQAAKILGMEEASMLEIFDEFAKNIGPPKGVKVTARDGSEIPDYKPNTFMAPEKKVDDIYSTDGCSMTPEELKEKTGWDRDVAAKKYADWDTAKLKDQCRDNEIPIRGNLSDDKLIERLLDFDQRAVETAYAASV